MLQNIWAGIEAPPFRAMVIFFKWLHVFHFIRGRPQGSWIGQNCYLAASDDNAEFVSQEDRFKYGNDLTILDLIMLGAILVKYSFHEHVVSDIGNGKLFLPAEQTRTQENVDSISSWTTNILMQMNKDMTNFMVFLQARTEFPTRST